MAHPVQVARAEFNGAPAATIASELGFSKRHTTGSARFAYFVDAGRFLVVAGAQEGRDVERALVYGMTYRGDRRLVLALPAGHSEATCQRTPWFRESHRPELYLHDADSVVSCPARSRQETIAPAGGPWTDVSPEDELRKASTAVHLGGSSARVLELVEWATTHPALDPGHRQSERSWHCMGQRVLSIRRSGRGVSVTGGIHYSGANAPSPRLVDEQHPLDGAALAAVQAAVQVGIAERLSGCPPIRRPDEHWLQAAIRRFPEGLGVEQPALREVPAWRPADHPKSWGRGFIDLLGMDGHGDIRIVETKLAANNDGLLVLQGLDYFTWAHAYAGALRKRLAASDQAQLVLHFVIGESGDAHTPISDFTRNLADALDDTVPWHFQVVRDWYRGPEEPGRPAVELSPRRVVP